MNIEAIYHRPKNNYAYAVDQTHIQIKLRTKKNDVTQVNLVHGDPYDWKDHLWQSTSTMMEKIGTTELFDYWTTKIKAPYRRLRYAFECQSNMRVIYYTERGVSVEKPSDISYYFCFPFIHQNDIFTGPKWVTNTIWYQIFPERFANGNPKLNPPNTLAWDSADPSPTNFFGGDFEGIINQLDYLVDLGINGIYFTPIFSAFSNHKYDTIDYLEIDEQFGDKKTFKRLMDACHARGIKVMLDAVFNHSGFYFPPFQDVLKKGEKSIYKDWFHIWKIPVQTNPQPTYDTFAFSHSMPKLNTANEEVKKYLLQIATYWIEEFDIDGWRLDVANEVDHTFWREFRTAVKRIKPDVYILGEIWHDAEPWLQGDQFDAVMNYPFTNHVVDFFAKDNINATQFAERMTEVIHMYTDKNNEFAFNLVESHDTARIMTIANHRVERVKLIYLFQFLFTGTPCIYYGGEVGMTGGYDPGCRACMIWDKSKQDRDLFQFLKSLISLRKSKDVCRQGIFSFTKHDAEKNIIVFEKVNDYEKLIVVMNLSANTNKINIDMDNSFVEILYNGQQFIEKPNVQQQTFSIKGDHFNIFYRQMKGEE